MLGINVNVEIRGIHYPIYFDRVNECVHCGAKGSLNMVDIFNREAREEIHPFDHIKCKVCGRDYSIKWTKDPETGKLYPCAVDPNIVRHFANYIEKRVSE